VAVMVASDIVQVTGDMQQVNPYARRA